MTSSSSHCTEALSPSVMVLFVCPRSVRTVLPNQCGDHCILCVCLQEITAREVNRLNVCGVCLHTHRQRSMVYINFISTKVVAL